MSQLLTHRVARRLVFDSFGGVGRTPSETPRKENSFLTSSGWHRFASVRLRFGDGTVRAVPVFGSGGSSQEGVVVLSVVKPACS